MRVAAAYLNPLAFENMMKIKYSIIALLLFFSFTGCSSDQEDNTWSETERFISPNKKLEAVLATGLNGNVSMVYVIPTGKKVNRHQYVFDADKIKGLRIFWENEDDLQIEYEKARIFHFTNHWHDFGENYEGQIEIKILQTSADSALETKEQ